MAELSKHKVLVAMSGGVDSSVAAKALQDQGFECVGCTMRLYDSPGTGAEAERPSGSARDIADAQQVAQTLGMEHFVFDFTQDFRCEVIDRFCASYLAGKTPNPCLDCNQTMKFGRLFDRADALGCWYLSTGHYVRVEEIDGVFRLRKARDISKDQSYVLYFLSQEQLSRLVFPLGDTLKSKTREVAADQGFTNAEKPESMDICFVPDGDYAAIVELHAGTMGEPGAFLNSAGDVIGQHKGIANYTIGQRKGLGLYGPKPVYVNKIDPVANTVTVGLKEELLARECTVGRFSWIAGQVPAEALSTTGLACKAKIRYRQTEQPAHAFAQVDGMVRLVFDQPQNAITPGQAAVLYDGEYVLGGGRIMGQVPGTCPNKM